MQVHFFRGPGRVFGATGQADAGNLPARYRPWAAFKSLEMSRGDRVPGVDVEECLDDIEAYGFNVTDAHVRIAPDTLQGG